jgi:hypothetical protein
VSGRTFDLGDVLSITTGRLVSQRGMDGIYDVLNFMTGDDLMTHQLPKSWYPTSSTVSITSGVG